MKRILAVDDEPDILKMLTLEIEDYDNFELELASNGAIALDLLRKKEYDALVTDLKMPMMGGVELLSKIKKERIKIRYIFVVSGNPKEYYGRELADFSIADYIEKPYNPEKMLKILSTHLED